MVLWWGRFDAGYSRNRILRKLFADLGWKIVDFHPSVSCLGHWEVRFRAPPKPDLIWVPCFRQRDVAAASRFARSLGVPLVFDPLISAYDKQVDERGKLRAGSVRAKHLLAWERKLFGLADLVIADTPAHADYFAETLNVDRKRLAVIYVGAEDEFFTPQPLAKKSEDEPLEVLFYGSFIPLQGPETIVEAAKLYQGPPVNWILVGDGPLREACEEKAKGMNNVRFEGWVPYEKLPARIHQADILLGVFGTTPKAGRVIPNKVYQSLACARPVITRYSNAFPEVLRTRKNAGLIWIQPGDARALADQVASMARDKHQLNTQSVAAIETSRLFFSKGAVCAQLKDVLDRVSPAGENSPLRSTDRSLS